MAIRLREVAGTMVAICAARSVPKDGDVYLDDRAHGALSAKFHADLLGSSDWPEHALADAEESNNAAREWWDSEYASAERGSRD